MWKILFIASFSFLYITIYSQTVEQTLKYANFLYEQQQYNEAVELYKRVLFFSHDSFYLFNLYNKVAEIYLAMNNYQKALQAYDSALMYSSHYDSAFLSCYFNKIFSHILLNDYHYALLKILDLKDTLNPYFYTKKTFYLAVIHYKIGEYRHAEHYFKKLYRLKGLDTGIVSCVFHEIYRIRRRIHPALAKTLSSIIPGLGQFVYGDIPDGINSLLLNALLLYSCYYFTVEYSFWDSMLFSGHLFLRYYKGGSKQAQLHAQKKLQLLLDEKFVYLLERLK